MISPSESSLPQALKKLEHRALEKLDQKFNFFASLFKIASQF